MTQPLPKITLVHRSKTEKALEEQLLELFAKYDLSKWFYAETVHIEDGTLPHSHPVLTLVPVTRSTRYLGNPEQLLHAYIHEQLHWFSLLIDPKRTSGTFNTEIRSRYPNLPTEHPEGCGSERSNYLHNKVNFLEYQALRELLGVNEATEIIQSVPYYTAIYALVLRDYAEIGEILTKNGIAAPERPPREKQFLTPSFTKPTPSKNG